MDMQRHSPIDGSTPNDSAGKRVSTALFLLGYYRSKDTPPGISTCFVRSWATRILSRAVRSSDWLGTGAPGYAPRSPGSFLSQLGAWAHSSSGPAQLAEARTSASIREAFPLRSASCLTKFTSRWTARGKPEVRRCEVVTGWGQFSGRLGRSSLLSLLPVGGRLPRGWKGRFQLEKPIGTELGGDLEGLGELAEHPQPKVSSAGHRYWFTQSGARRTRVGRKVGPGAGGGWAEEALSATRVTRRKILLGGGQSPLGLFECRVWRPPVQASLCGDHRPPREQLGSVSGSAPPYRQTGLARGARGAQSHLGLWRSHLWLILRGFSSGRDGS